MFTKLAGFFTFAEEKSRFVRAFLLRMIYTTSVNEAIFLLCSFVLKTQLAVFSALQEHRTISLNLGPPRKGD